MKTKFIIFKIINPLSLSKIQRNMSTLGVLGDSGAPEVKEKKGKGKEIKEVKKKHKTIEELEQAIEKFKDYLGLRGVKVTKKTLAIKKFDSVLNKVFEACQYREQIIDIILKKFPKDYIWELVIYLSSCDCCDKCSNKFPDHFVWRTIECVKNCDMCKQYYNRLSTEEFIIGMDFFTFCKDCNKPKKEKKCNCSCNDLYQVFLEALYVSLKKY